MAAQELADIVAGRRVVASIPWCEPSLSSTSFLSPSSFCPVLLQTNAPSRVVGAQIRDCTYYKRWDSRRKMILRNIPFSGNNFSIGRKKNYILLITFILIKHETTNQDLSDISIKHTINSDAFLQLTETAHLFYITFKWITRQQRRDGGPRTPTILSKLPFEKYFRKCRHVPMVIGT